MPDIKKTLSNNVTQLLDTRQDISRLNLSRQMRVADGTLGRIKYGNGNPNVETLEAIAKFFKFEAWQLLVAGFDPKQPPTLQKPNDINEMEQLTVDEKMLLSSFRSLDEPERTYLIDQAQIYVNVKKNLSKSKKSDNTTKGAA